MDTKYIYHIHSLVPPFLVSTYLPLLLTPRKDLFSLLPRERSPLFCVVKKWRKICSFHLVIIIACP
jgi:hypothetical protein